MRGWGWFFAAIIIAGATFGFGANSIPIAVFGQILFFLGIVGFAVSMVLSVTGEVARQR